MRQSLFLQSLPASQGDNVIRASVPTLNDDPIDFKHLFSLYKKLLSKPPARVVFDFSDCWFLRQNAVAFLGGLARVLENRGGDVSFDWHTLKPRVSRNLRRNGFLAAFGEGRPAFNDGNSIPYREDGVEPGVDIVDYLRNKWIGRGWVQVSDALANAIVGRVIEIYANAHEHASSEVGVFSCGQHYPNKHELILTVVDFGVGIPKNVRDYLKRESIPANTALKWAFKAGSTTKPTVGRGLGLDLLREFVSVNDGSLDVYSHDCHAHIARNVETYSIATEFFEGTLVSIRMQCDESFYRFAHEQSDSPLF